MTDTFIHIGVCLLPAPAFLVLLRMLDSYKLVSLRQTMRCLIAGVLAAAVTCLIGITANTLLGPGNLWMPRVIAPVMEELAKAVYLIYLIRRQRVGFMVSGAIVGFAIGAGFSVAENFVYLTTVADSNVWLWVLRGFGTAMMHGGNTAMVGIIATALSVHRGAQAWRIYIPGLAIAISVHSLYNFELLDPRASAVAILLFIPTMMAIVFTQSEKSLKGWLYEGFDRDWDLLHKILNGHLAETYAGRYLESLKTSFRPDVMRDMVDFLRLSLELSLRAKGQLMMREVGVSVPMDPTIAPRMQKLRKLESNIGRAGCRAISPLHSRSLHDLWEGHLTGHEAGELLQEQ